MTDAYRDLLGRTPDASGRDFWVSRLASGQTETALIGQMVGSSEFLAKAGGTTAGFVDRAYQTVLGRAPDAAGAAHWVAVVDDGTPRSTTGVRLYQSTESRRDRVTQLYLRFLDRPPDSSGLVFWSGRIATGGDVVLAADLAASPEYFRRRP